MSRCSSAYTFLLIFLLILGAGHAHAESKVVVVPLVAGGGPVGVEFASVNGTFTLSNTDSIIETVTLSTVREGYVIVTAQAEVNFEGSGNDLVRCSITTGTTIEFQALLRVDDKGDTCTADDCSFSSVALTRGFEKPVGNTTYRLVCDVFATGAAKMRDPSMTAIFTESRL